MRRARIRTLSSDSCGREGGERQNACAATRSAMHEPGGLTRAPVLGWPTQPDRAVECRAAAQVFVRSGTGHNHARGARRLEVDVMVIVTVQSRTISMIAQALESRRRSTAGNLIGKLSDPWMYDLPTVSLNEESMCGAA